MTEREALDKLLRFKPGVMVQAIDSQTEKPVRLLSGEVLAMEPAGPWVCVDFEDGERFAIWKATGLCYRLDEHGAAEDDPVDV